MTNEVTVVTTDVRPLGGALIRRAIAYHALALGDVVYISSYSGNLPVVSKASANAGSTANPFGVVVAGALASTTIAANEAVDIVVLGAVTGYTGMTSGNTIWVSNTTGRLSSVVGTSSAVVGVAESPATVFVRPGLFLVTA